MSEERIKEILGKYSDAFYNAETDKILSLWTLDGVLSPPGTLPIFGENAIWDYYNTKFDSSQDLYRWVIYFTPENISINSDNTIVTGTIKDTSETFAGGDFEEDIIIPGKFMMSFVKDAESNWKIKQFIWNHDKSENAKNAKKSISKKK